MEIEQRSVGDVLVLSIRGDITMNGTWATPVADTVRNALQEGHGRFVLDLGRVRYVDSAGLGELVQASCAVRTRGGAMKLLNVTRRVVDLLALTKLLMAFEYFDRESDALASFDRLNHTKE